MSPEAMILAPLVLFAFTAEAMTGFGAPLIAVTLGAHFVPIDRIVPILVPLSILVTGYMSIRHRKQVLTGMLFKNILPAMGVGLVIGTLIYPYVKGPGAKYILGTLVVLFAGRQLFVHFRGEDNTKPLPRVATVTLQVVSGIVQSIFASGGPWLVYSLSRLNLSKSVFRTTLCSVWATINTTLIVVFIFSGRYDASYFPTWMWLVPMLPLGIWAGEKLHGIIDERTFRLIINLMLLASGLILLLKSALS